MLDVPLNDICIVMMSAVGDAVHVLPVINALKRHTPACRITWVLQPGAAALVRGRSGGTANPGQATAGLVCGILGLAVGIVFAVRLGTFVASNTDVFTRFDNCLARASGRSQVADCIAQFARGVR